MITITLPFRIERAPWKRGSVPYSDSLEDHDETVLGTVTFDPGYPQLLADSYYLNTRPGFYLNLRWPSIGGDQVYGESTIPALLRWQSGEFIPDAIEVFADGFESGDTTMWSTAE